MAYELDIEKALSGDIEGEEMRYYANTFKSHHLKRYELGYMEHVCYCKKIFIFGEVDYAICSACKNIINKEIEEFYSIPELQDIFNVKNNGIYERIKIILFFKRDLIMKRKNRPDAWFLFIDRINLNRTHIFQVIKKIYNYRCYSQNCECCGSIANDLRNFSCASGASDRKMILAVKKCSELYPDIFSNFYRSFTLFVN